MLRRVASASSDEDDDSSSLPNKRKKSNPKDNSLEGNSSNKDMPNMKDWSGINSNSSPYINEDKTEGMFERKNCKFVYILNKEQFLYKKEALTRAWKVIKT